MTRVATPDNEDYLLRIAEHGTASHLERLIRGFRRAERAKERKRADEQHRNRELSCCYDEDDTLVIRGRLPPDQGALFLQALQAAGDALGEEAASGDPVYGGRSMSYSVRHVIETDTATFWRLVFDEELVRALIARHGQRGEFKVVEDRFDAEGNRHRRVEVWANFEMPAFFKKLVGDGSYTEVGHWDAEQMRYTADCVPHVNGDRFGTRYEIITRPLAGGSTCEREIVTDNRVRVPGLRSVIKNVLEKSQRESHQHSADFLNEWIRTRL